MIRSAFEILSWYLSPRQLPWFALAEFALALGATVGYNASGNGVWLVTVALGVGAGTYFAAHHYADLEHRPATRREREQLEREFRERFEALPVEVQQRRIHAAEDFAAAWRASSVDMATAAQALQRLFTR